MMTLRLQAWLKIQDSLFTILSIEKSFSNLNGKHTRTEYASVAVRQQHYPLSRPLLILLNTISPNFISFQVSFVLLFNLPYFSLGISYPAWPSSPAFIPLLMGLPLRTLASQDAHSAVKPLPPIEIWIEKSQSLTWPVQGLCCISTNYMWLWIDVEPLIYFACHKMSEINQRVWIWNWTCAIAKGR